jgi:hypothetical protein
MRLVTGQLSEQITSRQHSFKRAATKAILVTLAICPRVDENAAVVLIRTVLAQPGYRAFCAAGRRSKLSGHSMRIGAAQDMLVAGFDSFAIMQAGGWKSANVVLRYVENASTKELHERRWELISGRLRTCT